MTGQEVDEAMRREMNTLVAAYVLDALPVDERTAFEAYLDSSPETAHEVAELFATSAVLAVTNAVAPPVGLRDRVLTAAAQTRQLPPLTRRGADGSGDDVSSMLRRVTDPAPGRDATRADSVGRGRHLVVPPAAPAPPPSDPALSGSEPSTVVSIDRAARRRRRALARVGAGLAAAAVLVLAVVVTVQSGRLSDARQQTQAAEAQASALTGLLGQPDARTQTAQVAGGGQATVVVSRASARGVLLLNGVAAQPDGRTYQLWLIDAENRARSQGTFATSTSAATVDFDGLKDGDSVGISVEQAGGSPTGAPTTRPILAVKVA